MQERLFDMIIELRENVARIKEELLHHKTETKRLLAEIEVVKNNELNCPARKLAQQRLGVIQSVKDLTVIATIIILIMQILGVLPIK
jgi:hypothetical protein